MQIMTDQRLFRFHGLAPPVAFVDCDDLVARLPRLYRGWQIEDLGPSSEDPILTLRRKDSRYILEAEWLEPPHRRRDPIDSLCGFIAEFIRAYVDNDPQLLCLHGAAAEFAGRLIVFPNRYRAGKSVLSACLAAAGVRLFADDILLIGGAEDHGIAPGFALRLRLPLPNDLGEGPRSFIETHAGPSGQRYLYLDLEDQALAAHRCSAPIGGFVLLERTDGAKPELSPISDNDVLRQVIWQNFASEGTAPEILERLHRLVTGAQCYRLRYGRAEDAAALLKETFRSWPSAEAAPSRAVPAETVSPVVATSQPADQTAGRVEQEQTRADPAPITVTRYQRGPQVTEVTVEGERFLADPQGAAIHHLNPVASAVWHLLTEPMSKDQMVDLIHSAFPEVAREQIAGDVRILIRDLAAKQLLISLRDSSSS